MGRHQRLLFINGCIPLIPKKSANAYSSSLKKKPPKNPVADVGCKTAMCIFLSSAILAFQGITGLFMCLFCPHLEIASHASEISLLPEGNEKKGGFPFCFIGSLCSANAERK